MRAINKMNKKGLGLEELYPAVLTIVLIGIVLGIGLYVLAEVSREVTTGSQAETSINATITGLGGLSSWIAIIVVVIAAAIILGLVINSFGKGARGV